MRFGLFFMGEYAAMVAICAMMVVCSSVAGRCPLGTRSARAFHRHGHRTHRDLSRETAFLHGVIIWVRWMWPRFRYDQFDGPRWRRFNPVGAGEHFNHSNRAVVHHREQIRWRTMAFIKTTLTDEITGKNVEYCFNTEHPSSRSRPRATRRVTFVTGQKVLVDLPTLR